MTTTSTSIKHLPAEWEQHTIILMAFPYPASDWGKYDDWEATTAPFVRTAQAIAYYQMVYMLCHDTAAIKPLFCSTTNIIFIEADYDDTWARDYGPLSLEIDGEKRLLDFTFDGWGGKFEASRDNALTRWLGAKGFFGGTAVETVDTVLEGGSIDTDGAGTIITTSQCLCHPNRHGSIDKQRVENLLNQTLGTKRILWLDHGYLAGDDTDGHVDMLVRFVNPDTLVYVQCTDKQDEHYNALRMMEKELQNFRTIQQKPYTLIPLPMPKARYSVRDGRRLPASYANFLISNGAVIYPTYADPNDKKVGEILRVLFPSREVIPIGALPLIEEGGSLHCSTMQVAF